MDSTYLLYHLFERLSEFPSFYSCKYWGLKKLTNESYNNSVTGLEREYLFVSSQVKLQVELFIDLDGHPVFLYQSLVFPNMIWIDNIGWT